VRAASVSVALRTRPFDVLEKEKRVDKEKGSGLCLAHLICEMVMDAHFAEVQISPIYTARA
jgi:hypothetical protein